MAYPKIGQQAPDFSLQDQNGDTVTLSELKGKNVIVYFYPKALTPGCTTQACGLRDIKSEMDTKNVIAIGISPDPFARLKKFEEKHELNFTLVSDEDHAIAEKYGVWGLKKFMGKEFMGILRTTFIIDTSGNLVHVMDKFKTKTHDQDVLAWIEDNL